MCSTNCLYNIGVIVSRSVGAAAAHKLPDQTPIRCCTLLLCEMTTSYALSLQIALIISIFHAFLFGRSGTECPSFATSRLLQRSASCPFARSRFEGLSNLAFLLCSRST